VSPITDIALVTRAAGTTGAWNNACLSATDARRKEPYGTCGTTPQDGTGQRRWLAANRRLKMDGG
jgi:hypothetical protein